jgi:ribosomal protein S18 acetylase RimI-like enzyme
MASLRRTPWDTKALGVPAYEITVPGEKQFSRAAFRRGHYTVKVDPLASKALLHRYGFYYCDTLLEPACSRSRLKVFSHPKVRVTHHASLAALRRIARGAFTHGRFHRDFAVPRAAAEKRYENWLEGLLRKKSVLCLYFANELAGFIACDGPKLALHALAPKYRGKGMAKYFWSAACLELFRRHPKLSSSVSAANVAALNLYASLGFRLGKATDVYHRSTP